MRRSSVPTPAAVLLALLLALALLGPAAATAQVETPVPVPPATPLATPQAAPHADLAGVAPLPLTGERRAAFEAYVAGPWSGSGCRAPRSPSSRAGRWSTPRASASRSWAGPPPSPPTPC